MKRADRRRMLAGAALLCRPGAFLAPALAADLAHSGDAPLRVVASFSILADIVRNVAGDTAAVEMLVGPNSDAHVFEPTPLDARRLAEAELVVVNGLGFEGWMPRLVTASGYRGPVVVASEGITPRRENGAIDPHVWQALAYGQKMATNVMRALQTARPARRDALAERGAAYVAALAGLDRTLRARFERIPRDKRRVVTSHDAFGYFGDAFGIDFLAPLHGSTESEPSASTVGQLITQIRTRAIRAVFVENITDTRLVRRIAEDSGAVVGGRLYSDALSAPGSEADTYLKLYAYNAASIAAALGA